MRAQIGYLFGKLEDRRAASFIVLFTLDSACRALLVTIIPQQAYQLLGSAQLVSLLYFGSSFAGLLAALTLPTVLHHVGRRTAFTIASFGYVLCCGLFAIGTPMSLTAGLVLQTLFAATLEIVINLYLLDHIARRDLNRFEPLRLLFVGSVFVIGPWLGVYLHHNVSENLTYLIVAVVVGLFLASFWRLRLTDPQIAIASARSGPPPSPLAFVSRFARQPRLMLAWVLAIGRNGWWLMYFVYTPLLVASYGYSPEVGGALVSLGLMAMFFVRIWARLGARFGIRRLLVAGYLLTGIVTVAAGLTAGVPIVSLALVCLAAFFATTIDGAGNVPFLRAVHPYERAAMTSVYMTFRHVASLAMPGTFAVVLAVAPLPFVFVAGGVVAAAMAGLSRYLPKRL